MSVLKCLTWTTRLDKILEEVQPGDLVKFHRGLFVHHAVYVGRGRAVHHHLGPGEGEVIEATMAYLAKGDLMKVFKVTDTPFSPREVIRRARSQIGPRPYSLHNENCEHFTTWVYHGVRESTQLSGLCRYELRLLRFIKHSGSRQADAPEQQRQQQHSRDEDQNKDHHPGRETENVREEEEEINSDAEEADDGFVFVPPRSIKYRHTKNPARIACNHARSCLKVLAVQSVLGLAALPLYRCSLQADNVQRLGRQLVRSRRSRHDKQSEEVASPPGNQ